MSKPLFATPEIKKAFEDYNKPESIRLNKIACWCVFFAMPAGFSLDLNIYPRDVHYFLMLRLVSSLLVLALFGLFYSRWGIQHHRALSFVLPLVPQTFITWMIYVSEGANSPYYAGLCLVLLAFTLLLPWNFVETLTLSLATLFMYSAACVAHGSFQTSGIFFSNLYFLVSTAFFTAFGSYFTNQLRVREFITRFELDKNKKELEETNRRLVELDQMKSRFFANISHELRTPLTLLLAPLEALFREKESSMDAEMKDALKTMLDNAMRLLKLINDLLDLVKMESGRMKILKEPVDTESFLRGMLQLVQGAARDKRVNLSHSIAAGIGTILADRDKMEKILLNLLFNAVKFTPAGGTVELSCAEEGDRLVFQVKDTGMGISEENLPFIFDRFWQADSSAQRKYQGTGIGLSLVKELSEIQGGSVHAESRVGEGTVMTVKIPLEKTEAAPAPSAAVLSAADSPDAESPEWLTRLYRRAELFPAMTPVRSTLRTDSYARGKRPRVLVADDEPDMLRFLTTQLGKHYEVVEAVDGNQAVEKARQFLPDLIILDMMMPEKDGIQACRELKGQVSTQAIPVLMLTARADDETKLSALGAGANDFLTKPFSTTEVHVRVKNLVESHQFQLDLSRQKSALESTLEQLKETEGQLIQSEKMASLGRLSAGIIHEINNPLNYASQALYLLKTKKDRLPEEERAKYVEIISDIEDGVGRVQHIVSDLRTFSHPHSGGGADLIDLAEAVETALRFLSHELKDKVRTEVAIPKDQQVVADRNKLIQVFVNLAQNSVDAMGSKQYEGEGPALSIRSRMEGDRVLVEVRDNGPGIDPKHLDKIFDPFFTTKDVGEGMGLGLSVCYRILTEQGGGITVKSEKEKYTAFTLELPAKAGG